MTEIIMGAIATIIGSIITAIVAYNATVHGVYASLAQQRELEEKKEKEQRFKMRPKFKIIKDEFNSEDKSLLRLFVSPLKGYKKGSEQYLFIHYDNSIDEKDYIYYDYKLVNIGLNDSNNLYIVSNNKKQTCLMDFEEREYLLSKQLGEYCFCYDKIIVPKEEIKLRFYVNKKFDISNKFFAMFSILYEDEYGTKLKQAFFYPQDKLYESKIISEDEYKQLISIDEMYDRMDDPYRAHEGLRNLYEE